MEPTQPSLAEQGAAALRAGNLEEAHQLLYQAVTQNPGDSKSYGYLGVCLARKGAVEESLQCLGEAARLLPNDPLPNYNLGIALMQANRVEESRAAFERVLAIDPNHDQARAGLDRLAHMAPAPDPAPLAPVAAPTLPQYTAPPPVQTGGMSYQPAASAFGAGLHEPDAGLRILRGLGWGAIYGQTWTFWFLVSMMLWNMSDIGEMAAGLAFVTVLFAIGYAIVWALVGLVIALVRPSVEAAAVIGTVAAIGQFALQYAVGLRSTKGLIWGIFIGYVVGRYDGAQIAARVMRPVQR